MQQELFDKGHDISILGINAIGLENSTPEMVEGRSIPWLQDETNVMFWDAWGAQYRDVYIFDTQLNHTRTINLSTFDLHDPDNYDEFFEILTSQ